MAVSCPTWVQCTLLTTEPSTALQPQYMMFFFPKVKNLHSDLEEASWLLSGLSEPRLARCLCSTVTKRRDTHFHTLRLNLRMELATWWLMGEEHAQWRSPDKGKVHIPNWWCGMAQNSNILLRIVNKNGKNLQIISGFAHLIYPDHSWSQVIEIAWDITMERGPCYRWVITIGSDSPRPWPCANWDPQAMCDEPGSGCSTKLEYWGRERQYEHVNAWPGV